MKHFTPLLAIAAFVLSSLAAQATTVRIEATGTVTTREGVYLPVVTDGQEVSFIIEYDASIDPYSSSVRVDRSRAFFTNVTQYDVVTGGQTTSVLAPGEIGDTLLMENAFNDSFTIYDGAAPFTLAGISNTVLTVLISGDPSFFSGVTPAPTVFDRDALTSTSIQFSLEGSRTTDFFRVDLTSFTATATPVPLPAGLPLLAGGLGLLALARRRRRAA